MLGRFGAVTSMLPALGYAVFLTAVGGGEGSWQWCRDSSSSRQVGTPQSAMSLNPNRQSISWTSLAPFQPFGLLP